MKLLIVAGTTLFVRAFLADQIRMLVVDGFEVLLVCPPSGDGPDTLAQELGCAVQYLPIARTISPVEDLKILGRMMRLTRAFRPDVVHSHSPKAGLLASVAAWLCRVPVRLHTVHGLRSECLHGLRCKVVRSMERLTLACCTTCFAAGHSLRAVVLEHRLCTADKLNVLGEGSWAGVPVQHFEPRLWYSEGYDFRRQHGISAGALVITFVGRLTKDKGLETLARAWEMWKQRWPAARLLVAGPLDNTDPVSEDVLAQLRADDRVVLKEEFIQNVAVALAATDIFVQPSFREGLSVASLEAAAMELPLVVSRATGLTDVVKDGETGFVFDKNHAVQLAAALTRLAADGELRRSMGLKGRALVREHFDRRDVLQRSLEMYRAVAMQVRLRRGARGKRALDLTVALLALLLAGPVMLLLVPAVMLTMGQPVLFRQKRAGLNGTTFELMKFRTMRAPNAGERAIGTDALRTTWLGSWMRRLSLDELPQLFNVLRGEMSLIGPRPLLAEYLPRYNEYEAKRHQAMPGITGWAQIHGRNTLSWSSKFELDVWYVEHQSLGLDLKILASTFARLIRPAEVSAVANTAMPEFLGSTRQSIQ